MANDNIEGGDNDRVLASEIANIIKAASLGAGVGSVDNDSKGGSSDASSSSTTMTPQSTPDQIINLVQRLKGSCSQFHDGGWWSYELCHMQQFRQFHVDIRSGAEGVCTTSYLLCCGWRREERRMCPVLH
jgi:hypothetical protein